ncbi:MAG: NAD(P)(+) transhydrogenase (Re/Si-specific) subunit beta, partial [Actinomycetota bacterium]
MSHGWQDWVQLILYVGAGVGFVLALKWLTHPASARRGVRAGELGMTAAVIGTLLGAGIVDWIWVLVAVFVGSAIGAAIGLWVPMTAMPQRIAFSHAFGALAAALVGTAAYLLERPAIEPVVMAVLGLEMLLGYLTFTGSLMAFGKLQGWLPDRPFVYPGQNLVNIGVLLTVMRTADPERVGLLVPLIAAGLVFGVMFVIRIGGADMPTVISLLNSFAGLSGAALGFV